MNKEIKIKTTSVKKEFPENKGMTLIELRNKCRTYLNEAGYYYYGTFIDKNTFQAMIIEENEKNIGVLFIKKENQIYFKPKNEKEAETFLTFFPNLPGCPLDAKDAKRIFSKIISNQKTLVKQV